MAPSNERSAAPESPIGAYGLALRGVESARSLLVPAEPDWPAYELELRQGRGSDDPYDRVSEWAAELQLRNGGQIVIDRAARRATFTAPSRLRIEELIHPYLAPVAAVIAYWLERESFHAGALVSGGGAWGLLGDRESGKSSTLGWLARHGHAIVCDDMLIVDGGQAFAGPRSVDLRGEAAEALGAGEPLGMIGARERWRLTLGPVEARLPLKGWIFLAWGDTLAVEPVSGSERIARLTQQRGVRLPPRDADRLLDLAQLPGWELRRPPGWDSLPQAAELLLDTIGA